MNVDDADPTKIEVVPDQEVFARIYHLQHELMVKYEPIEARNGLTIPSKPYLLDDMKVQLRIKDFFWRTVEELMEAIEHELDFKNWRTRFESDKALRHFFEELADALHFLVEASIISGYLPELAQNQWEQYHKVVKPSDLPPLEQGHVYGQILQIVKHLGLAANTLKNKPWKQTQMPTDEARFMYELTVAWGHFIQLWMMFGVDIQEVYTLYCRKHQVNQFRQRSAY